MKDEKNKLVERLRMALKAGGYSFKEAASKAGVSDKTLEKWVQGVALPRIDQFAKLVPLGVNPIYVLTGQGPPLISGLVSELGAGKKKLWKKRSC